MIDFKEILMGLPSQIEIAEALNAMPSGDRYETVRRMSMALDLLRAGGWEFVEANRQEPKKLEQEPKKLEQEPKKQEQDPKNLEQDPKNLEQDPKNLEQDL